MCPTCCPIISSNDISRAHCNTFLRWLPNAAFVTSILIILPCNRALTGCESSEPLVDWLKLTPAVPRFDITAAGAVKFAPVICEELEVEGSRKLVARGSRSLLSTGFGYWKANRGSMALIFMKYSIVVVNDKNMSEILGVFLHLAIIKLSDYDG